MNNYPTIDITIANYGWTIKCYEITERESQRLEKAVKEENEEEALKIFADLLVEWNCTDRQGNPLPANVEGLKDIPQSVMRAIFEAIGNRTATIDPNSVTA